MSMIDVAKGWPKDKTSPDGLDRAKKAFLCNHTLLVGQSRSGKTNAARRIVEEMVARTSGRVVILDPNADFSQIDQLDQYLADLKTKSPTSANEREDLAFGEKWSQRTATISCLGSSVADGKIRSVVEEVDKKLVVVDLSSDDARRYKRANAALEAIWEFGQAQRVDYNSKGLGGMLWPGTLVVIDEAHLFAPRESNDSTKECSERIERISDQGKKLNLYLLLVTQQPGKLNQRILAEADNRIIMRMNDRLSLKVLEDIYGGRPGRYDGALTFPQGWALVEGAMVCDATPPDARPRGIKFGRGRTRAGGGTADQRWVQS